MRVAIDYSRLMTDDVLSATFVLRMSKADREQLARVAERLPLKAAAVARIALRIGLAEIERDPACIFAAKAPEPKPAKKAKR